MTRLARLLFIGQLMQLLAVAFFTRPPEANAQSEVRAEAEVRTEADVRREAGRQYRASALQEFFLGHGYRDLWATPITIPELSLSSFAGGLEAVKAGGHNQTRTLHLRGADGRSYIFRTVDKFAGRPLPDDLKGTLVESALQDGTMALHPAGALMLPPLLEAAGLLHVKPQMFVMPDDARLGEHRADFGGMLGQLEEKPDKGGDGRPGFAGATKIDDTEEMIEHLRASSRHRLVEAEWIAARLIDFLVGDTDRGPDQWRFAAFKQDGGRVSWRPIPRDRDLAFARAGGLLPRLVAPLLHDKLPRFDREVVVGPLTITARRIDRAFTMHSDLAVFDSVATELRQRITDDVIRAAVAAMPSEYQQLRGAELTRALLSRRAQLAAAARDWYELLANEIDVHGTNEADHVLVERSTDGSVTVVLRNACEPRPHYQRRFLPNETDEIRIYLHDGADSAVVQGQAANLHVRVIGGKGDDALIDTTAGEARGTWTVFYDDAGANSFRTTSHTRVNRTSFEPPAAADEWMNRRLGATRHRDWGTTTVPAVVTDYSEGANIVLGAGLQRTRYGFRHVPYDWRARAALLYAVGAGKFGVEFAGEKHLENSRWLAELRVRASKFGASRFYGYGNDTPDDEDLSLIMRDEISVEPALTWQRDARKRVSFSAIARYFDPRPPAGNALERLTSDPSEPFGQIGVRLNGVIDHAGRAHAPHGVAFELAARALTDPTHFEPYAHVGAEARAYATGSLAVRVGAAKTFGPVPFTDAAFIGGSSSLRGYRHERFAGDAALYGGLEVRVPIARITLITHGQLRAVGLVDAGRVYVNGRSSGNWHAGVGGGLAFTTVERTISVTYAHGEQGRIYVSTGTAF